MKKKQQQQQQRTTLMNSIKQNWRDVTRNATQRENQNENHTSLIELMLHFYCAFSFCLPFPRRWIIHNYLITRDSQPTTISKWKENKQQQQQQKKTMKFNEKKLIKNLTALNLFWCFRWERCDAVQRTGEALVGCRLRFEWCGALESVALISRFAGGIPMVNSPFPLALIGDDAARLKLLRLVFFSFLKFVAGKTQHDCVDRSSACDKWTCRVTLAIQSRNEFQIKSFTINNRMWPTVAIVLSGSTNTFSRLSHIPHSRINYSDKTVPRRQ